jgi:hypothetical protein
VVAVARTVLVLAALVVQAGTMALAAGEVEQA